MGADKKAHALLIEGINALQLSLADDRLVALTEYLETLLVWSRKMNLIGKGQDLRQVVGNHFLDSLLLLKVLPEEDCSLVDIGTGAGFPGLVCKVARPDLGLVLIEPRLKRVSFLRQIIRRLGLKDVQVHPCRVEELSVPLAPQNDSMYVTSRAVAEIGVFLQMVMPLVADCAEEGARVVCMKGPKWQEELAAAQGLLDENDLVLAHCTRFELPWSGAERVFLTFYKQR